MNYDTANSDDINSHSRIIFSFNMLLYVAYLP